MIVRGEELISIEIGLHPDRRATCRLDIGTYSDLVHGQKAWDEAFANGTAQLIGSGRSIHEFVRILEQLVALAVK